MITLLRTILRWLAVPLWIYYLAVMHLAKLRDANMLTAEAEKYAKPVLYFGLIVDLLYNWTWATIYFLDLPREPLVTDRLKRYAKGQKKVIVRNGWKLRLERVQIAPETGWRLRETHWLDDNFLGPADPDGRHV